MADTSPERTAQDALDAIWRELPEVYEDDFEIVQNAVAELGWLRQVAETARSAVLGDSAEERSGALEELRLLIEEGMT